MMSISHADQRLSWHGAVSLERTQNYTRPWRIPFDQQHLFFPALASGGATQAGVRLSFYSNTNLILGEILPAAENQKVDLVIDGVFFASYELAGQPSFEFTGLGTGQKLIELWLPQRGDFALKQLWIAKEATLRPYGNLYPKWVTYGSSITHCVDASSPTRTWPAIVAQARQLNLTCLGFGGQCHLDVQIARVMRDLPSDYFSICAGINIYSRASLNERTFAASLVGFIQIIREKHPVTPILLISPIYGASREETANSQGWTLARYRMAVEEVASLLRTYGDTNIQYLNGLMLFDSSMVSMMPDKLHPNASGYESMARKFLTHAASAFFENK